MSENDKFTIIDEKLKRKEKPKRISQSSRWQIVFVIMGMIVLVLGVSSVGLCFLMTDCGSGGYTPDLELTATSIVATNRQVANQLTETQIAFQAFSSVNPNFETVTAIAEAVVRARVTETPMVATITPTPTLRPAPVFSWASQDLPDIALVAEEAFDAVEILEGIEVRVLAYGENCLNCGGAGQTSFGAMTTDFYLIAEVESLDDGDHLSQIIIAAVDVLMALDVELPAQLGYFDITFTEGDESQNVRVMFYQIEAARAQGVTGSELLTALGGLH